MSEVKRYHVTEAGLVEGQSLGRINVVLGADHDRVTAERDALQLLLNQRDEQVESLEQQREAELRNGQDMQQRLTAADELVCERTASLLECGTRRKALERRVDVLEGLLREVVAPDPYGEFLGWQLDAKIDAALKTAEGGGEVVRIEYSSLDPAQRLAVCRGEQPVAMTIPDECPHLIVFNDTDRENMLFAGLGARSAALKTWEKISMSWNAHLFVRVDGNCRDDRYPSAVITPASTS